MSQEQFQFDFFSSEPNPPKPAPEKPAEPAPGAGNPGVTVPGEAPASPEAPAPTPAVPQRDPEPLPPSPAPSAEPDFEPIEMPMAIYFPEPVPDPGPEPSRAYLSGAALGSAPEKPKSKRGRKSQKLMAEEAALVMVPDDEVLFSKAYYGISEVAQMFAVNTSLLRFWEAEFSLTLRKNRKGDRFFTPKDVKMVQLIYDLLRRRKLTIDGARDYLRRNKGADERLLLIQSLQRLRGFLLELKAHF